MQFRSSQTSGTSLEIVRSDSLPPLAWLLNSEKNSLCCGLDVESRSNGFFEGAWDGSFAAFDFGSRANVFGSGAVATEAGWLLVPPSHTLEAIYILKTRPGAWVASNSLAFLMTFADAQFTASDRVLLKAFVGIFRGLEYSPATLPTTQGTLHVLHHHNAILTRDGITVIPKPLPTEFKSYGDYKRLLSDAVAKVSENAAHAQRRAKYALLCTVSTGYDSPACAAIARKAGCTEAITFTRARGGDNDDGSTIGRAMGLTVQAFERSEILGRNRIATAQFYATGMHATDLVFEALAGKLSKRLLVTGVLGDKMWGANGVASSVIKRDDIAGCSFGEFRLSEGFLHLPVPFVGARQHSCVLAISRSQEMRPYSIGGYYDRPVPRRLAEEAGVPRGAFGRAKKAIIAVVYSDNSLLSDAIRQEIESSLGSSKSRRIGYWLRSTWCQIEAATHYAFYRSADILPFGRGFYRRTVSRILRMGRPWTFIEHSHPFNILALKWAVALLSERYYAVCRSKASNASAPQGALSEKAAGH